MTHALLYANAYIYIYIHTNLRSQTQICGTQPAGVDGGIRIINLICTACIYVSKGSVWLCKCLLASCT